MWEFLLGSPTMQSYPQARYIVGDVAAYWGSGRYLIGALSPYYGGGPYLRGIVTAIPYYPKPIAGSRFQRTASVVKEV